MGRLLVALGVVLLCACLVTPAGAGDAPPRLSTDVQEFDHVEFRISIQDDGSARWTFQYGKSLANDTEAEQFREFAAAFENGTPPLYEEFRSEARSLTATGRNATGRNMTARQFDKRANVTGLGDSLGIVEMSFTWTGFAVEDGDELRVGDVFDGGLYLGPDQRLVVEAGDEVAFQSVQPTPDDVPGPELAAADSVTWNGEQRFNDERPSVVLRAVEPPNTTAAATSTAADPPTTAGSPDGTDRGPTTTAAAGPGASVSTVPWLAITAFAAAIVVGAVVLLQQVGIIFTNGRAGGGPAALQSDGDGGPGGPGGPVGAAVEGEPSIPDEEMLTDEERVLGLLRENGGRMRQVNIVEETDWSKSKVSMLLSEMEDDDQVTKLRVGRENIVSLPGHEPDASDSALE